MRTFNLRVVGAHARPTTKPSPTGAVCRARDRRPPVEYRRDRVPVLRTGCRGPVSEWSDRSPSTCAVVMPLHARLYPERGREVGTWAGSTVRPFPRNSWKYPAGVGNIRSCAKIPADCRVAEWAHRTIAELRQDTQALGHRLGPAAAQFRRTFRWTCMRRAHVSARTRAILAKLCERSFSATVASTIGLEAQFARADKRPPAHLPRRHRAERVRSPHRRGGAPVRQGRLPRSHC
jgi:hypothetical protein